MLLHYHFDETGKLRLKAATFSKAEFKALDLVLKEAGVGGFFRRPFKEVGKDHSGRMRREYVVGSQSVKRLEKILDGEFKSDGTFVTSPGAGQWYACREITMSGLGGGCENIRAIDEHIALVKCAFVAGRNSWFGGMADRGSCSSD
jgi:hypothetical protein